MKRIILIILCFCVLLGITGYLVADYAKSNCSGGNQTTSDGDWTGNY